MHVVVGRAIVWTDGGADHPTVPLLAHASSGVVWVDSHVTNLAFHSIGMEQDNRGETDALIAVLLQARVRHDAGRGMPIFVRTDFDLVAVYANTLLDWIYTGVEPQTPDIDKWPYPDLWHIVDAHLRTLPVNYVACCWVKGHAAAQHVHLGLTTELGTKGNTAADAQAGLGLLMGGSPPTQLAEPLSALGGSRPSSDSCRGSFWRG